MSFLKIFKDFKFFGKKIIFIKPVKLLNKNFFEFLIHLKRALLNKVNEGKDLKKLRIRPVGSLKNCSLHRTPCTPCMISKL